MRKETSSSKSKSVKLLDEWTLLSDNDFAKEVLSSIRSKSLALPSSEPSSKLCPICRGFSERIWEPFADATYRVNDLKCNSKANSCDLCALIWKVCSKLGETTDSTITVMRIDSSIKINGEGLSALSIYRSLETSPDANEDIQLGYPSLAHADSETHFELIRQWLQHCDGSHKDCFPAASLSTERSIAGSASTTQLRNLPKRVIDVGKSGDDKVYLRETSPTENCEWIALSHQWGQGKMFRTVPENLENHTEGIAFAKLPKTFRDAVTVTRALNCPNLWIDSICIVQGDYGEFKQEAKRMEDVYNGAYCVLAAARSPGHDAGFLHTREQRATVTLQQKTKSTPFYICETIDDFNLHVQESLLNKRGWVFQEHALARRTVYFTEYQTYFECGDGIRCETMTKMKNELATFMGDPNFPQIIMGAGQGERILRYQDLYKTYSCLDLKNPSDRPIAIDSLQARVLKALGANGEYGVLDEGHKGSRGLGLLRRSLLWCRAGENDMSPITFLPHHSISHVPSWSWMKYTGIIDYISPPFGDVDWEDFQSPWSSGRKVGDALVAEARGYDASAAIQDGDGDIILDRPSEEPLPSTKCIVMGRKRGMRTLKDSHRIHYLLVVEATKDWDGNGYQIYKRIGAGYLPGKCIEPERVTISVH